MSESGGEDGPEPADPADLPAVTERLSELQRQRRETVRWQMSRDTAERAIAAITRQPRQKIGAGKSRRRKRHKRLL
jgi:hypothetical protein